MTNLTATDSALASPPMGTFDSNGEYTPREIVLDDLGTLSLDDAYSATMVDVADGQIVEGTVVRVDRDEVLLDIGYKSEGVIPPRELSIRSGVHPGEIVSIGVFSTITLGHPKQIMSLRYVSSPWQMALDLSPVE